MDLSFLNKQVNKISDTNELSVLFFKLKKLIINEHSKMIKLRKEYENNNDKINALMEKIVTRILETIDEDILSEESEEDDDVDTTSEEDDQLKSDDIQLLSDSDDK